MVKFRIGKVTDANQLTEIHLESGKNQPGAFMHLLGFLFLKKYYQILLQEKHSLIIVAEDETGLIYGFCSGTMDASEHIRSVKSNKIQLGLAAIPAILRKPKLLRELIIRKKHISDDSNSIEYNTKVGVRNEYWGWRNHCDKSTSPELFKTWRDIVYSFGYSSFRGEVDLINKQIVLFHKFLGGRILKEITLPDGRKRYFVEYKKK